MKGRNTRTVVNIGKKTGEMRWQISVKGLEIRQSGGVV